VARNEILFYLWIACLDTDVHVFHHQSTLAFYAAREKELRVRGPIASHRTQVILVKGQLKRKFFSRLYLECSSWGV